jgi:NO-binding membrane sensor protein with MHYT domain
LADVNLFAYGPATPAVATVLSITGCLLGIVLISKAPVGARRARVRLFLYGSVAVSVVGVWIPQMTGLASVDVSISAVRYDPVLIGISGGIALVAVSLAVLLAMTRPARRWRTFSSGGLLAVGVIGSQFAGIAALRVAAPVEFDPLGLAVSVVVAIVGASACAWSMAARPGLRPAALAAGVMGVAVVGAQVAGVSALRVSPAPDTAMEVTGLNPIALIATVMLGVVLDLMLWYFTVGSKTMDDLRAVFSERDKTIDIEPWLIREITERIAVDIARHPDHDRDATLPLPTRRPPGPRPTPGITPVWKTMPAWGTNDARPAVGAQTVVPTGATRAIAANRWHDTVRKPRTKVVVIAPPLSSALASAPTRGSAVPAAEPAPEPPPTTTEMVQNQASAARAKAPGWGRNTRR